MKKHTFIAAAAAVLMAAAPATHSFAKKQNAVSTSNIAARQLESADTEFIYLQVTMWQNEEKTADFRITDTHGEVLYSDRFKTRTHTITLKFLPQELSNFNIELATAEGDFRRKYEVETTTSYHTGIKDVSKL